jgi:rubrerythrin
MLNVIERLKVQLSVRFAWTSNRRRAEAIRGFQATEADGVWHLHRGMRQLADPKQRAVVFTHGLEEESHADEFAAVYKQYGDHVLTPLYFEREDLYAQAAAPWKTFAFVHVGEQDATQRFRFLRDALEPGPLKSSLDKIIDDESGHVDLTSSMLTKLGAKPNEIRREVQRVRTARLWERWMRLGKRVVDQFATLLLSILYFAVGPLVAATARRRLTSRVVEVDNARLKRL